ncbi:MAG: hypothetical protein KIC52_07800 [Firmicutes bacterium]|nr:hypothetical protein [Bacillota bacterium]
MSDKEILEEVQKIYNDISEWLKYAETKNAGVFAVWTAFLIGIATSDIYWELHIYIQILLLFPLLFGLMLTTLTFLPFLNRISFLKQMCYRKYKGTRKQKNILFYQDVFVAAGYKEDRSEAVEEYRKLFSKKVGRIVQGELVDEYFQQIVDVSTVAIIKIYLFGISVRYIFILLLIVIIGFIIA